jgi:hypothetical protein
MREVISGRLWIGNARDARDVRDVLQRGITAIIDLAIEEPPIPFPRDVVYCRVPLLDGEGNAPARLAAVLKLAASLITDRVPTLIACSGGMSRSPALAAGALALARCGEPDEVLRSITIGGPADISPRLWADVTDAIAGITAVRSA